MIEIMGKVTVRRLPALGDLFRKYQIIIDGKNVGYVKNNQVWTGECSEGPHSIQLKIDWKITAAIAFESTAEFECQSPGQGWKIFSAVAKILNSDEYIQFRKCK